MKITRSFAHRVELPLHEGSYKSSGGKSVSVFDSTIVGFETDAGPAVPARRLVALRERSVDLDDRHLHQTVDRTMMPSRAFLVTSCGSDRDRRAA